MIFPDFTKWHHFILLRFHTACYEIVLRLKQKTRISFKKFKQNYMRYQQYSTFKFITFIKTLNFIILISLIKYQFFEIWQNGIISFFQDSILLVTRLSWDWNNKKQESNLKNSKKIISNTSNILHLSSLNS